MFWNDKKMIFDFLFEVKIYKVESCWFDRIINWIRPTDPKR